jgi:hypothetical protein
MVVLDLVYSGYDWESHYYFVPPPGVTQEDFEVLCEELLPQAGYRAVLKHSHVKEETWITWREVVEALIPLLEAQGYQRCELPTVNLRGSGIIGIFTHESDERLGFATKLILDHNHKLEDKLNEEAQAKKTRRIGRLKKKLPQIMK